MAKRSRRVIRSEPSRSRASATADGIPTATPGSRSTRRANPRRAAETSTFDRLRAPLIGGVAIVGVLIIGYFFLFGQGSASAAYNCLTELTPAPAETLSTTPAPEATPTPSVAPSSSPAASPSPSAAPTPRLGFTTAILGRDHVATGSTITYGYCPPDSGNHYNDPPRGPIPAKFYAAGAEEAPGGWVHNLEHGYVVVLYRCPSGTPGTGDCISTDEYAQLQAFIGQAPQSTVPSCPNKVLVARFDSMSTKFALLAWGRAYLSNQFDLDTANTFVQQWMDHPAVPERFSCAT